MVRYSSYKDSGVKWLGEIPSHWELKHLRNFLSLFSEKGFGEAQLLSVTREKGVILRDKEDKEENHNFVPDDLSGYKHLFAGDFVINKMKSWQGSYGVSEYEGIVSPAYFTCKLRGVDPQFFSCAIRSKAYIGFFMQYSKGIRVDQWDLDPSSMKDIPFILPPYDEQKRIVQYLNAVTADIDEAIAQQQSLIDLLNERKRIIIFNAVTKGLDLNVELKDSGIEWVGKMPSHWDIFKGKVVCRVQCGCPFDSKLFSLENGFPLIRIRDITSGKIETYFDGPYEEKYVVRKDDLLVGMDGDFTVRWWNNVDALLNQRCCRVFPNEHVSKRYLYYYLPIGLKIINDMTPATTVKHLSDKDIKNMPICVPSIKEQEKIVAYLDEQTSKIDVAIENANRLIELLRERKQIIVKDVVTGKIKVYASV